MSKRNNFALLNVRENSECAASMNEVTSVCAMFEVVLCQLLYRTWEKVWRITYSILVPCTKILAPNQIAGHRLRHRLNVDRANAHNEIH